MSARAVERTGGRANVLPHRIGMREVVTLAWPIMISMLSYTVMMVVDTLYVGQLGTAPLAGIGLATTVFYAFICFGMGTVRGMKVVVSQRTGAGDEETVRRALWQGLWVAWAIGAIAALLAPVAPIVFGLLGASDEVQGFATAYLLVRLLAAPISLSLIAMGGWFEGRGDTRTPMKATLTANGLNILIDPVLIFGWGPVPALGIAGAALATVVSVAIAVGWLGWRLHRSHPGAARPARPDLALLREIARFGLPMGVRGALEVSAFVVFVGMLARVGDAELAAHVIVVRVLSVSFMPGHAVGEAASVLVGHAIGGMRAELATQAWRTATWLALGVMAACGVLFAAIPEPLIAIFGAEQAVVDVAGQLLLIAAAFQVVDALALVAQGALNGAGDTRFVMGVSVFCSWGVNLPLAWLLAIHFELGAVGAWLALTAEISVCAALSVGRVLRGRAWDTAVADEERRRAPARAEPATAGA